MAKMIKKGKTQLAIRLLALELVKPLPSGDWIAEIRAIHQFVLYNIRYVGDIADVETLTDADKTLSLKQGDCDDKVILAGALLQTINHPVRMVALGFYGKPYSHVILETLVGRQWIPLELTVDIPCGQMPEGVTSRMVWHVGR